MSDIDIQKKSGWHNADIVAALRKAGWSLRRLSVAHGYSPHTIHCALHHSYPNAERIIAEAIGVKPSVIWPDRYAKRAAKASTKSRLSTNSCNSTPGTSARNTQSNEEA